MQKIKKYTQNKGFTLIELLLYLTLMTGLVTVISGVFSSVIESQLEAEAVSSIDQDARYIVARLTHDMQSASAITLPSSGSGDTLQIVVNSLNYTYALASTGDLQLTNTNGTDNLNSNGTQLSNVVFQRIGSGGTEDTVKVSFTITSRGNRLSGDPETRTIETTLGLQ